MSWIFRSIDIKTNNNYTLKFPGKNIFEDLHTMFKTTRMMLTYSLAQVLYIAKCRLL